MRSAETPWRYLRQFKASPVFTEKQRTLPEGHAQQASHWILQDLSIQIDELHSQQTDVHVHVGLHLFRTKPVCHLSPLPAATELMSRTFFPSLQSNGSKYLPLRRAAIPAVHRSFKS
eukprot:GHVT01050903.1.p1 GENE.GHVT01050903.1~~GHVT01050903.1.p1  ORF type:complete len:117 (-),score=12.65 GHVT01050903.1:249-599(-)